MRRRYLYLAFALAFLSWRGNASAQEITLPAGTLLHCTLDEPNFSSATAQVGDPVICHASAVHQFGHVVFTHGSYLTGRFTGYRDPGHFWGKGWMKLDFDRIALPNTELAVPGKVISVQGYPVDREGKIRGRGHPRRDAIEWMIPPLWPWKLLTLPARGPRPALKGEVPITLRLMEDVSVPLTAEVPRPTSWKPLAQSFAKPAPQSPAKWINGSSIQYLPPRIPALENDSDSAPLTRAAPVAAAESASVAEPRPAQLTLVALKGDAIYAVRDYWVENGRLYYVLPSGAEGTWNLSEVDWGKTTQFNAERGITVTLRARPHVY